MIKKKMTKIILCTYCIIYNGGAGGRVFDQTPEGGGTSRFGQTWERVG